MTSGKRVKSREKAVLTVVERRYRTFILQALATSWRGRLDKHDTYAGGDRIDDCCEKHIFIIVRRFGRTQNHCPRTDTAWFILNCTTSKLPYHVKLRSPATTLDRLFTIFCLLSI